MVCIQNALSTWKDLTNLADGLRNFTHNDNEVFANMALQLTHQFDYVPTEIQNIL